MARRIPRSKLRERALDEARSVALPERADVVVAGGGAAGLVAAIAAAEAGASATVLEGDLSAGRSILATGGGRCNFSNRDLSPSPYRNPELAGAVFGDDPLGEILGFFGESGLAWTEEDGRLYPRSMQAASVRDVLLARAGRAGVAFGCARTAVSANARECGWEVGFSLPGDDEGRGSISCSSLVLATGRSHIPAGPLLDIAEGGPVLCPLAASGIDLESLDGRRARAELRLSRGGREIFRERGELLFRSYGISGIVAFNLSRAAMPGDALVIDLAPELEAAEIDTLRERAGGLAGVLDPAIADSLGGRDPKHLELAIEGPADAERSQVMRGGISAASLDGEKLAVTDHAGLFACGECVDVDGPCGGYNLSWAWMSGLRAGRSAAAAAGAKSHAGD